MFWVDFGAVILSFIFGAGIFFRFRDVLDKQRNLVQILILLKNESEFNSIHRGDQQSPFQISCLEKALSNPYLFEQCDDLASKSLELFELAKDANSGNLWRRGFVPSHVQDKMTIIATEISTILPIVKKRTNMRGYTWWQVEKFFKKLF